MDGQLRVDTVSLARSFVPVAAALLAAVIGALCYRYGSDRLDFAAHFVAGLGGTMLLLSLLSIKPVLPPRRPPILVVIGLSCGIGIGCEALFFVDGGFDLVDVSNQCLGALTAGLIFAIWPVRGTAAIWAWVLLAVVFLAGGARIVGIV